MPKNRVCNGSRNLVGDCFLVHGRLRTYNGIAFRIGVIGTGHMLGIDDEDRMRSKVAKEQTFDEGKRPILRNVNGRIED